MPLKSMNSEHSASYNPRVLVDKINELIDFLNGLEIAILNIEAHVKEKNE